jgi:hypothetical protein
VDAAILNEAAAPKRHINEIFTAIISIQGSAPGAVQFILNERKKERINSNYNGRIVTKE